MGFITVARYFMQRERPDRPGLSENGSERARLSNGPIIARQYVGKHRNQPRECFEAIAVNFVARMRSNENHESARYESKPIASHIPSAHG
jgi:hypothetical protein